MTCGSYYSKEKNGNRYQTEEDEVTTQEQPKTWYSSFVSYTDQFVRVSKVRRNLF